MKAATVTQYGVLANTDLHKLILDVNEAISEGWTPLGGVIVTTVHPESGPPAARLNFFQTIVRAIPS